MSLTVNSSSNQPAYFSGVMPSCSQIVNNVCKVTLPIIVLAVASNIPEASANNYLPCYMPCMANCLGNGAESKICNAFCASYCLSICKWF